MGKVFVGKIKIVVICSVFLFTIFLQILKRKPKVKHEGCLEGAVLLK